VDLNTVKEATGIGSVMIRSFFRRVNPNWVIIDIVVAMAASMDAFKAKANHMSKSHKYI
jgi:hypothetical protein